MMKNKLGGKTMKRFVTLRTKIYAYRKIDKKLEDKCWKATKKCVVIEGLTFIDYKPCFFDGKTIHREEMLLMKGKKRIR